MKKWELVAVLAMTQFPLITSVIMTRVMMKSDLQCGVLCYFAISSFLCMSVMEKAHTHNNFFAWLARGWMLLTFLLAVGVGVLGAFGPYFLGVGTVPFEFLLALPTFHFFQTMLCLEVMHHVALER